MSEKIIKTQAQMDKIKADFDGTIYVEGGTRFNPIIIKTDFEEAYLVIRGEAYAELWGSSHAELWGSSHAVLRGSSHAELWGSSHAELWGSSHAVLRESSHAVLRESSHAELWGSSHAELWGSSHAVLRESSHAELWGSSHAKLYGESMVTAQSAKEIVAYGYNVISLLKSNQKRVNIVANKDSYIKIIPDMKPVFEDYAKRYPVDVKRGKATFYKAVHKTDDGRYTADWDTSFIYEVGKTYEIECDTRVSEDCSYGLNVSPLAWAHAFGCNWNNLAIIEVTTAVKDVVVPSKTDGKVRTSKLKVVREVPRDEWYK